jgi:hypothetical protein
MTLAEFYAAEYDESYDVGVYVIKNGNVLYVGMSTSNIWNRWFYGTFRSHLERDGNGRWWGNTPVGRAVASNMPDSWQWKIELWGLRDCAEFFGYDEKRFDIRSAEQKLMVYYKPKLNVQA